MTPGGEIAKHTWPDVVEAGTTGRSIRSTYACVTHEDNIRHIQSRESRTMDVSRPARTFPTRSSPVAFASDVLYSTDQEHCYFYLMKNYYHLPAVARACSSLCYPAPPAWTTMMTTTGRSYSFAQSAATVRWIRGGRGTVSATTKPRRRTSSPRSGSLFLLFGVHSLYHYDEP